ncbi:hypothetical protein [Tenacibaculum maritimum]|uniref:hypothetical protein n=1 Tax=Tenacibaculum maritimum TaxID=107401 RepID=UPI00132F7CFE|nr:hypothetical protein [Tenacibaculum maritimum]
MEEILYLLLTFSLSLFDSEDKELIRKRIIGGCYEVKNFVSSEKIVVLLTGILQHPTFKVFLEGVMPLCYLLLFYWNVIICYGCNKRI